MFEWAWLRDTLHRPHRQCLSNLKIVGPASQAVWKGLEFGAEWHAANRTHHLINHSTSPTLVQTTLRPPCAKHAADTTDKCHLQPSNPGNREVDCCPRTRSITSSAPRAKVPKHLLCMSTATGLLVPQLRKAKQGKSCNCAATLRAC
jgi:hypothetical protein